MMKSIVVLFALLCTVSVANKMNFTCPILPPSPTVPTSVHRLRPGDIKVIGAIGDSLTAGRGAKGGLLSLFVDDRGVSFSGGGQDDFGKTLTLANILREYNPNLYGYAIGNGGRSTKESRLNVARSGAISLESLAEAKILTERMKNDPNIDFANDWKIITIFIGGNDLCDFCKDLTKFSVANYTENLRKALDYLHDHVPRVFINLMELLDVEVIKNLNEDDFCHFVHESIVCKCAAFPKPGDTEKLAKLREGYQDAVRDLASSERYNDKDDFTIVDQPFFRKTELPRKPNNDVDLSYFATDCFHLSKKGHEAAAVALWNNMFEPVQSKSVAGFIGAHLKCPSKAFPYLYTAKNSNSSNSGHFGK